MFPNSQKLSWIGIINVVFLLIGELILIHSTRHAMGIECYRDPFFLCGVARNTLLASYGLVGALALLALFDRAACAELLRDTGLRMRPLLMNLAGLGLIFATLPVVQDASMLPITVPAWVIGAALVLSGAALMIAPVARWRVFLSRLGIPALLVSIAGACAPFIALRLRHRMEEDFLTDITFTAATNLLQALGTDMYVNAETKVIGAREFYVNIAPACSGVEGLVLTTVFATIYVALFRKQLRFPHVLILFPVALLLSWTLNIVRIAALFQIGISGYRDLALGGFHSHAGWMMFTLLSLGIVLAAQTVPFFQRKAQVVAVDSRPSFFADPAVAQIFPFLVFMASALLASTFAQDPALVYPLRAVAMAAGLALFLPYLRALPWRLDMLSVGAGLAIGVMWIVTAPASEGPPPFAALSGGLVALWIAARCIGTTVLVPIIEELFFRGYLMERIAPAGADRLRVFLSIAITSALFAALHDRWIEAGIAGVIFALLYLRSRNVTDAIISHAAANGLIAAWALGTGNWGMI